MIVTSSPSARCLAAVRGRAFVTSVALSAPWLLSRAVRNCKAVARQRLRRDVALETLFDRLEGGLDLPEPFFVGLLGQPVGRLELPAGALVQHRRPLVTAVDSEAVGRPEPALARLEVVLDGVLGGRRGLGVDDLCLGDEPLITGPVQREQPLVAVEHVLPVRRRRFGFLDLSGVAARRICFHQRRDPEQLPLGDRAAEPPLQLVVRWPGVALQRCLVALNRPVVGPRCTLVVIGLPGSHPLGVRRGCQLRTQWALEFEQPCGERFAALADVGPRAVTDFAQAFDRRSDVRFHVLESRSRGLVLPVREVLLGGFDVLFGLVGQALGVRPHLRQAVDERGDRFGVALARERPPPAVDRLDQETRRPEPVVRTLRLDHLRVRHGFRPVTPCCPHDK